MNPQQPQPHLPFGRRLSFIQDASIFQGVSPFQPGQLIADPRTLLIPASPSTAMMMPQTPIQPPPPMGLSPLLLGPVLPGLHLPQQPVVPRPGVLLNRHRSSELFFPQTPSLMELSAYGSAPTTPVMHRMKLYHARPPVTPPSYFQNQMYSPTGPSKRLQLMRPDQVEQDQDIHISPQSKRKMFLQQQQQLQQANLEAHDQKLALPSSVASLRRSSTASSSSLAVAELLQEQSDSSAASSVSSTPTPFDHHHRQFRPMRTRSTSFRRDLSKEFAKEESEEEEDNDDEADDETSKDAEAAQEVPTPPEFTAPTQPKQQVGGLGGERRLNITFYSFGEVDPEEKQTFGKYGWCIPNGLSGSHTMYAQPWRFEIAHGECMNTTVLTWKIVNLTSNGVVSLTETPQQAAMRQTKGNTICNVVLRRALDQRAAELEKEILVVGKNPNKIANFRSLIKELKPKQCTEGLLFFGLRHESVQLRKPQTEDKATEGEANEGVEAAQQSPKEAAETQPADENPSPAPIVGTD